MFKLTVGVGGVRGLCGADRAGLLPGNSNLLALLKVAVWYIKLCPPLTAYALQSSTLRKIRQIFLILLIIIGPPKTLN